MRMTRTTLSIAATLLCGTLAATTARAEDSTGFRLDLGTFSDHGGPMLGIAYEVPLREKWTMVPNTEFALDNPQELYTFSVDGHYEVDRTPARSMWLGTGLGVIHRQSRFREDTDPALNMLWGMTFALGEPWTPFIRTKAVLSADSEFALSFGIRFGPARSAHSSAVSPASPPPSPNRAE